MTESNSREKSHWYLQSRAVRLVEQVGISSQLLTISSSSPSHSLSPSSSSQDSGSTGNPLKVKPSYQSCKDCLRLPQGRRCDRPAGGRSHRLNPSRHCTVPTICVDPPDTNFTSTPLLHTLQAPILVQPCGPLYRCNTCSPSVSKLPSPMSCEDTSLQGAAGNQEENTSAQSCQEGAAEQQMPEPEVGIEFGVELMQQRAAESQLPAGPLP